MISRTMGIVAAVAILGSATLATAEPAPSDSPDQEQTTEARTTEAPSAAPAGDAASDGVFLPFTLTPSSRPTFGVVNSGYDGARKVVLYQAMADAHVVAGLSVRAGYTSHDLSGQPSALLGARYQLLRQANHGLDLGVGLFYAPQDVVGEGLVKGSLSLSRKFGRLALFGTAGYGQDPEGDDHRAEGSVASLYVVVPAFLVGLDARARALVLSSDEKHNGVTEPVFDIAAGPLAQYLVGPVALSGQVGMSAVRFETHGAPHASNDMRYGFLGLLTAGLSL
jgi:hypothetical protein